VNVIDGIEYNKKSIDEVTTPMIVIFKALVKAQMIQKKILEIERAVGIVKSPIMISNVVPTFANSFKG